MPIPATIEAGRRYLLPDSGNHLVDNRTAITSFLGQSLPGLLAKGDKLPIPVRGTNPDDLTSEVDSDEYPIGLRFLCHMALSLQGL